MKGTRQSLGPQVITDRTSCRACATRSLSDGREKLKVARRGILQKTIDLWQAYYAQSLTEVDAREIIENTARFFDVLVAWERKSGEESMMGGHDREEKATESVAREETSRQPGEIARLCPDVTHSEAASTGEPKHFRWRIPR